jgi:hypothetical protein
MGDCKEKTKINQQTIGVRGDVGNSNVDYNGEGGVNRRRQVILRQL